MKNKKFLYLTLILLASCSKGNIREDEKQYNADCKDYVINATLNPKGSKVYIKDEYGALAWDQQDSISVFDSDGRNSKYTTENGGSSSAEFHGQSEPGKDYYIALHPYNRDAYMDEHQPDDVIITELSSVQTAKESTFDSKAFICLSDYSSDNPGNFNFENLCGGLRFSVNSDNITSVKFRGNDEEILSGDVMISLPGLLTTAELMPTLWGEEYVLLKSETALEPGKYYFLTFIPQSLDEGFTMEFYSGETLVCTTVCKVPIEIYPSVFSTINGADLQSNIDKISGGTDLARYETANCYIVSKPGYYKFPACKGNSNILVTNPNSASVAWESINTSEYVKVRCLIDSTFIRGNYIYFHAVPQEDGISVRNGNAFITVRNSDRNVLWSWHIWLCDGYDPIATKSEIGMMDRNLGALKAGVESCGLLYQWGRKDPFIGASDKDFKTKAKSSSDIEYFNSSSSQGTYANVISAPDRFIMPLTATEGDWLYYADNKGWNENKTLYDPCPPGWRVTSKMDMEGCITGNFPFGGYLSETGVLTESGTSAYLWTCTIPTSGTRPVTAFVIDASQSGFHNLEKSRAKAFSVRCTYDE